MPVRIAGIGLVLLLVTVACGDSTAADPALDPGGAAPTSTTQPSTASAAAADTDQTGDATDEPHAEEPWSPKTIGELIDPVLVVDADFAAGIPEGWYPEIWMKPGDDQGEITVGQGVRFTGRGGSTRSGIMTDVRFDVEDHTHLVLSARGVVMEQGLAGTGWHGREAPLAVLVTYVDADGTEHVSLGEDPTIPTAMFFRGFTALPEPEMINGVEVTRGEAFTHQFDLMALDPAPATILAVGVEGAGWDPRVGEIYELSLAAGW